MHPGNLIGCQCSCRLMTDFAESHNALMIAWKIKHSAAGNYHPLALIFPAYHFKCCEINHLAQYELRDIAHSTAYMVYYKSRTCKVQLIMLKRSSCWIQSNCGEAERGFITACCVNVWLWRYSAVFSSQGPNELAVLMTFIFFHLFY